jgi:molybdopterin biosynthesis enzyme
VLERMSGRREPERVASTIRARSSRRLAATDREDHVRVALTDRGGTRWASPLPGGSAVITSMVRADGIVVVPMHTVIEEGAEVEVRLLD